MLQPGVIISSRSSDALRTFLDQKKYSKIAVLTDENTRNHCLPVIAPGLPEHALIVVKSGEEQKNLETCTGIWQKMTDFSLDRHAVLIVLGGGVLGDMGGFCAATYKRGIDFVLIPTTLLAQSDASIGGKLGIDFNHFKNHIGVFQLPALTILDGSFLTTLPGAELRSGYAEVIKHTLISDEAKWNEIRKKSLAEQNWQDLIAHSAEFKSKVVTEDPREAGLRKILNAGHTIGHALESYLLSNDRKVLHGEAVAAGLVAEAYISLDRKMLTADQFGQIKDYVSRIFGKVIFEEAEIYQIAALAIQDKKNKGNRILCVLLDGIGKSQWDCEISLDEVKRALSFYRSDQM